MKFKYLILAIIGLAWLGFIVYQKNQVPSERLNQNYEVDWKTYTFPAKDYGFSMKYPPNWSVIETSGAIAFESAVSCNSKGELCSQVAVAIFNNGNKSLEPDFVSLDPSCPDKVSNKDSAKLDRENALILDYFQCNYGYNASGRLQRVLIANHKGKRFEISFDEAIAFGGSNILNRRKWRNEAIFNAMLGSFKFLTP